MLPVTSSEHGTQNNDEPPTTTIEIDMPGPECDIKSGEGQEKKNEQMLEKTDVGKEDEEEKIKEDGDAEINAHSPPTKGSNESPGLDTSQMKHISFATDELSVLIVPNSSHD